jgi:hypothetical protein
LRDPFLLLLETLLSKYDDTYIEFGGRRNL